MSALRRRQSLLTFALLVTLWHAELKSYRQTLSTYYCAVGVDCDVNVTEEMLDFKSLIGQTRGVNLFLNVCSAVDDMKLPWSKVSEIITDCAPAMAGERSG